MRKNPDRGVPQSSNSFPTPPPPPTSSGRLEVGFPSASTWCADPMQSYSFGMNNPQALQEQPQMTNTIDYEAVPSHTQNQVPHSVLPQLFPDIIANDTATKAIIPPASLSPHLAHQIPLFGEDAWMDELSYADSGREEIATSNKRIKRQQTTDRWRRKARVKGSPPLKEPSSHLERKAEQIIGQLFKLYESALCLEMLKEDPDLVEQLRIIQSRFSPLTPVTLNSQSSNSDSSIDYGV